MVQQISNEGELLFFRYAYPCAWGRYIRKKIDELHYERLNQHSQNGTAPDRQTLRYCFPHAFRRLREYANATGKDRWNRDTVSDFWRLRHGHTGDCMVKKVAVVETLGPDIYMVIDKDKNLHKVVNLYRLPIGPLDLVFTHLRTIIEKEE